MRERHATPPPRGAFRRLGGAIAFASALLDGGVVLGLTPELLAPGDGKSSALDPAEFAWARIRSIDAPLFRIAYDALWAEFGPTHEMETEDVLAGRFAAGSEMQYEIVLAMEKDEIAAVRDHTAIWADGEVVVHLSHVLVMEPWRRSGLAGWMRAVPILVAREVAAQHGAPDTPITLVGEMEYDDGSDPKRGIRLKAYERAGYLKVDPPVAGYHQPDFRRPSEIDASGGARPLPFQLIVRQVGMEGERTVSRRRLERWVRALHTMYGAQFRAADMAHADLSTEHLARDPDAEVALWPPTAPASC